jgi:hypothetical protein
MSSLVRQNRSGCRCDLVSWDSAVLVRKCCYAPNSITGRSALRFFAGERCVMSRSPATARIRPLLYRAAQQPASTTDDTARSRPPHTGQGRGPLRKLTPRPGIRRESHR